MLLDLNEPASIVSWWAVYPERHGALLADWSRRRTEHRAAILQARRLIKADPHQRALLQRSSAAISAPAVDHPVASHDELMAGEVDGELSQ